MDIFCVVTGQNESGKSVIVRNTAVKPVSLALLPGYEFHRIWGSDSARPTFHEWAGHSIAHSHWARSYYQQQRERGKGHHAAVRGLAFKWIRIFFVAGKTKSLMTRTNIWLRSPNHTHRSLRSSLK